MMPAMFGDYRTPLVHLVLAAIVLGMALPAVAQDKPRRIYAEKGEIRSPAVAPDGQTLVYSVWQDKRYAHKLRVLTMGKRVKANDVGWGVGAVFSPDGRSVLYLSEAKGDGKYWVSIAAADGSKPRDLGIEGSNPEGNPPAWTPDGSKILLVNPAGTFLVPVAGGDQKRISVKPLGNVTFSADGARLVFEAKGGGISTMTVDSGAIEDLTRRSRGLAAKWAPDGKHIAWIDEDKAVVLDVATGKRTTVGTAQRVVWTHDGGGLLLLTQTGSFTQGATTPIPDMAVSWVGLDGKPAQPIDIAKVHHAITGENGRTVFFAVHGDGIYRMALPVLAGAKGGALTPDNPGLTPGSPAVKDKIGLPKTRPKGTIDADTLKAIQ